MRVAILGGTGSFGRALAARLAALGEDEIVIGSRDAERARETAAELGGGRVTGATNEDAVRGVDLVVLAVKADAALDTARTVAGALGDDAAALASRRAIEFRKGVGALPDPEARSLAERIQERSRARSPRACIRSPRRTSTRRRPRRMRSSAVTTRRRRRSRSSSRQARRRQRARRRAARERPRARGTDRGDRQPEPPLQGARRHPGHRRPDQPMIEIIPVRGLPEIRQGDDLAALIVERAELADGDVVVVAQKAVSKAEGRVVRARRLRAVGEGARARRRRARPAGGRGDPPRGEADHPRARAARDRADPARVHLRLGRRRPLERAGAGHARAAAASIRTRARAGCASGSAS